MTNGYRNYKAELIPRNIINRSPSYDNALTDIDWVLHFVLYEDCDLDDKGRLLAARDWTMYRTIAQYEGHIVEVDDGHGCLIVGSIRRIGCATFDVWGVVVGTQDNMLRVYFLTFDPKKDCDVTPASISCDGRVIWSTKTNDNQ